MALRKNPEKLLKVTLNLAEEDWRWFQEIYTRVGASEAVRTAMKKHRLDVQKKIKASRDRGQHIEGEIEDV